MSYRDWFVGMKVVCVNARGMERYLVAGKVYTIAGFAREFGEIYVRVTEPSISEGDWYISRFRPVQPRKTDISIFQAMLTDARRKVYA